MFIFISLISAVAIVIDVILKMIQVIVTKRSSLLSLRDHYHYHCHRHFQSYHHCNHHHLAITINITITINIAISKTPQLTNPTAIMSITNNPFILQSLQLVYRPNICCTLQFAMAHYKTRSVLLQTSQSVNHESRVIAIYRILISFCNLRSSL